ncbi:hypothetical protein ASE74_24055 [Pedobacter sp. Leaf216]|uniref:hypothetical protein n=1 Tax=Pedobacter sp. Leaf216 TaxID=1735684 RepID=UPI0006FE3E71|nr:hypothetical protein [Pedobacter sp. Leaf216]KQM68406.1 hypothetical protein ASE74_24055 [Pedobacter sp. Leaf216]
MGSIYSGLCTVPQKSGNFDEIDYQLPQSGYTVKIKITKISTKLSKNAFSTKADQYAIAKKVDGYFLTIRFMVTNPYDHEMMIPVHDYFYIKLNGGILVFHQGDYLAYWVS